MTIQGVVSLELLTVFVVAPLACLVCYDIAKKNPRANILMVIIATAELDGGECTLQLNKQASNVPVGQVGR